jgi:hypothetical protein
MRSYEERRREDDRAADRRRERQGENWRVDDTRGRWRQEDWRAEDATKDRAAEEKNARESQNRFRDPYHFHWPQSADNEATGTVRDESSFRRFLKTTLKVGLCAGIGIVGAIIEQRRNVASNRGTAVCEIPCPNPSGCSQTLRVRSDLKGRWRCPKCSFLFEI